ncbi:MAG: HlyC/CorC family transporter [Candidatus Melainabacteria bacterium]|nr:HlyC/CorC family transporter [Candidatus Melainabacteria bacterium]MBI3309073.1 HlyC/CorC family transporter [Candidatus Melainabacteria bacterium]
MTPVFGILLGILFVLLNGLFVAIEFALARINRTRVEQKASEGDKTAQLILAALDDINSYISAAQVGITIASLALGAIGEITIAKLLLPIIDNMMPADLTDFTAHSIALPIALLIVTYFHTVVGEIIPKTVAFVNPLNTASFLIWPLEIFRILTNPLVAMLNASASGILKTVGIKDIRTTFVYTEDELKMLLNVSHEEGVLEETEKEMITKIFDFPDTVAREIMTPRTDMICMNENIKIKDAIKGIAESKHSRIPIYKESIDNITGVVTTRDLLEEIPLDENTKLLQQIAKLVHKVPESKPIDDLLTEMQRKSLQLAIVIDEFGGTAGLITIEDILEEIVGEIHDEFEEKKTEPIQPLHNNEYLIDGKLNIDEINEKLGTNFSKEHHDTIGGLTFGLLGKEPNVGDEVQFNSYKLRVESKQNHRIKQVRLSMPNGNSNMKEKYDKKEELMTEQRGRNGK